MDEDGRIMLTADDGSEEAFFVWEKVEIAGREYLLVSNSEPTEEESQEEADALILRVKEQDEEEDGEILYEVVEDENELLIISKYFEELLDDIDISM